MECAPCAPSHEYIPAILETETNAATDTIKIRIACRMGEKKTEYKIKNDKVCGVRRVVHDDDDTPLEMNTFRVEQEPYKRKAARWEGDECVEKYWVYHCKMKEND